MPHTHATTDSQQSSHDHGDPLKAYLTVFVTLLVLLCLTVGAYEIPFEKMHVGEYHLGVLNTVIALTIATIKALLVVLVFMHLRYSTKLTWVVATAGFIWLGIMIMFFFSDYLSRSLVHESLRDAAPGSVQTNANSQAKFETVKDVDLTPGW